MSADLDNQSMEHQPSMARTEELQSVQLDDGTTQAAEEDLPQEEGADAGTGDAEQAEAGAHPEDGETQKQQGHGDSASGQEAEANGKLAGGSRRIAQPADILEKEEEASGSLDRVAEEAQQQAAAAADGQRAEEQQQKEKPRQQEAHRQAEELQQQKDPQQPHANGEQQQADTQQAQGEEQEAQAAGGDDDEDDGFGDFADFTDATAFPAEAAVEPQPVGANAAGSADAPQQQADQPPVEQQHDSTQQPLPQQQQPEQDYGTILKAAWSRLKSVDQDHLYQTQSLEELEAAALSQHQQTLQRHRQLYGVKMCDPGNEALRVCGGIPLPNPEQEGLASQLSSMGTTYEPVVRCSQAALQLSPEDRLLKALGLSDAAAKAQAEASSQ